jgi:DNA-binding transcriptional LysR family regulator
MVAPFLAAYPEITLEAVSDDMRLDLVANRFDAGLRIGELIERDMIAVKLIDRIRLACVASPAYLKRREVPQVPADLMQHECIRHRWKFDEAIRPWEFEKDGERVEIEPQGRLIVNEAQNVATAAASGVGVGYLPLGMVARQILEKRLVQLLPDWSTAYSGVYIYYPSRRQTPAPLQAFIDFARKATSQRSADMQAYDLSVAT